MNTTDQTERTGRSSRSRPSSSESVRRNLPPAALAQNGLGASKPYYQLRTSLSALPMDTGRLMGSGPMLETVRMRHRSGYPTPVPSAEPQFSHSLGYRMRQGAVNGSNRPQSTTTPSHHHRLPQPINTSHDRIQQVPTRERPQLSINCATAPNTNAAGTTVSNSTAATRRATDSHDASNPPMGTALPTQSAMMMAMMNRSSLTGTTGFDRSRSGQHDSNRTHPSPSLIPIRKPLVGNHGLARMADYLIRSTETTPWRP